MIVNEYSPNACRLLDAHVSVPAVRQAQDLVIDEKAQTKPVCTMAPESAQLTYEWRHCIDGHRQQSRPRFRPTQG